MTTQEKEISIDEIMKKIKEEVARNKQKQGRASLRDKSTDAPRTSSVAGKIISFNKKDNFSYKDRYHINDFLQYHDEEFITYAYRAILRRDPDSGGYEHYLSNLRNGTLNKIEILGRLRYSTEGSNKNIKIKGLSVPFMINYAYQIPVIGYPLRLFIALARLPRIVMNMQTFESFTTAQFTHIAANMNTNIGELGNRFQTINNDLINERLHEFEILQNEKLHDSFIALEKLRQDLSALTHDKADIASIEEINEQLLKLEEDRSAVAFVDDLRGRLALLEAGKADTQEIEAVRGIINTLETGMADIARLEELEKDIEAVRGIINAMETGKADIASIEEIHEQLLQLEADKAGAAAVDDLWRLTEKLEAEKADREAVESINHEIQDIVRQIKDHRLHILDQQRRLALLLEDTRKRLPGPVNTRQINTMLTEEDHLLDAFYASFEDRFRGVRADIKLRLQVYLPYIKQAEAGVVDAPVLDLGCGRGEWLELLKENGYAAKGVDNNRVKISQCMELGLDAVESDMTEYLRKQKANSTGAITGFHIVEHLPFKNLIALFDEALRVLRPGGMVIFETPNPENILVGACSFYIDPSHQRPIPSIALQYFIESRGFNKTSVLKLHKDEEQKINDAVLQNLLFGEQDYAVIGYKS